MTGFGKSLRDLPSFVIKSALGNGGKGETNIKNHWRNIYLPIGALTWQSTCQTVSCRSALVDITSASYIFIDQHLKILINIKIWIDENL